MIIKAKPTGIVVLMPAGWQGRPPGAPWRPLEVLSEGCLMDGMNKFTVLGGGNPLHPGCADPINGELRATAAVDGGPTQGWTTTFRMQAEGKQFVKKFVSEQWILSCNSLGR